VKTAGTRKVRGTAAHAHRLWGTSTEKSRDVAEEPSREQEEDMCSLKTKEEKTMSLAIFSCYKKMPQTE
jgi:hypothetical protein